MLDNIASPFLVISATISLSILAVIFFKLSKEEPEYDPSRKSSRMSSLKSGSSIKSIVVAEFDEDAEFQARIWN